VIWHLLPALGAKRLDAIGNEQVQKLKLALVDRAPKTVNNVLTVLSTLLKKAVEWGELDKLPCTIKLLPNPKKTMGFHDFGEYERLLTVAQKRSPDSYLMVLLGGDAGLRLGEIVAIEWVDVDLHERVGSPSSGRTGAVTSRSRKTGGRVAFR
jgi:integrase